MAEHRDLAPRAPEVNAKGVDPVARRKVILMIIGLGLTAALIWTALIMRGESTQSIGGVATLRQPILTVSYNEQGWPILTDERGDAVHPEDLDVGP